MYAVSYDPVDVLADFSDAHDITYPLLADVGSRVITELGILNTSVVAERQAYGRIVEERHRGIPYPGTFVLDGDGIVIDRHFEDSHRIRPTTRSLLAPLDVDVTPEVVVTATSPGVEIRVSADDKRISANQLQRVVVEMAFDEGSHGYVEPIPAGYTALSIEITGGDDLRVNNPQIPTGSSFTVEGLDEDFFVIEGNVRMEGSFYIVSGRDTAGDAGEQIDVTVSFAYQVCTAETCFMPERIGVSLPIDRARPRSRVRCTLRGVEHAGS